MRDQPIGGVSQIVVDRRGIAHEADPPAGQGCGLNETLKTKENGHRAIIKAACWPSDRGKNVLTRQLAPNGGR